MLKTYRHRSADATPEVFGSIGHQFHERCVPLSAVRMSLAIFRATPMSVTLVPAQISLFLIGRFALYLQDRRTVHTRFMIQCFNILKQIQQLRTQKYLR